MQKFIARQSRKEDNGSISWAPGGPFDCLGYFAKIQNCPIDGTPLRLTCYATGYPANFFSIPACTRYKGQRLSGYFTGTENGPVFVPHNCALARLGEYGEKLKADRLSKLLPWEMEKFLESCK